MADTSDQYQVATLGPPEGGSEPRDAPTPTAVHARKPAIGAPVARGRLCILCGQAVRGGQHLIRVHGNTVHARCSGAHRDRRAPS